MPVACEQDQAVQEAGLFNEAQSVGPEIHAAEIKERDRDEPDQPEGADEQQGASTPPQPLWQPVLGEVFAPGIQPVLGYKGVELVECDHEPAHRASAVTLGCHDEPSLVFPGAHTSPLEAIVVIVGIERTSNLVRITLNRSRQPIADLPRVTFESVAIVVAISAGGRVVATLLIFCGSQNTHKHVDFSHGPGSPDAQRGLRDGLHVREYAMCLFCGAAQRFPDFLLGRAVALSSTNGQVAQANADTFGHFLDRHASNRVALRQPAADKFSDEVERNSGQLWRHNHEQKVHQATDMAIKRVEVLGI